jgi:hypothetical protein
MSVGRNSVDSMATHNVVDCSGIELGRNSVDCMGTNYVVDCSGIESRWGGNISHPSRPTLGNTQPSYTTGMGSFPEVKRPGRGPDHPPPFSAEVKEILEL